MNKLLFIVTISAAMAACKPKETADLLITNGKIWTGNESYPWATWVAVKNERVIAVGNKDQPYVGQAKQTMDIKNQLMLSGFNDSHVHFASAGHLLLNINLLDVNSIDHFIKNVKETTDRLPSGSWITRGDWGAYEAWSMGSSGGKEITKFTPHRNMIDSITSQHPVLVTRYDRKVGLANALALDYLGIDSENGLLEGNLLSDALDRIPEKSFEQLIAESKRALEECRKWGVTTIQDMSPPVQLDVYNHLRENGELTCRINYSPSRLIEYTDMKAKGWVIDWSDKNNPKTAGDEWISFGTLKTHIDGIMGARTARFYEPYSDNDIENRFWKGGWREFSRDMPSFKAMITETDKANIQLRIHAIGDEANAILIDILDTLNEVNGEKDRRFRLVHAQVISEKDFPRLKKHNIVAEVQPFHVTDDMRWMEERIGYERCKGAYAFKTLKENGATLSFGSDWPGTNASYYPVNPLYGLYAAVTRQTINGDPEEGWFPEQRLSLEESLKAYTYGSSFGAFEEHMKGSIEEGKLADFVILDADIFETQPAEWLKTRVNYTLVGGKIVYQRED